LPMLTHKVNRLDIENTFLQQQNAILQRELSQARFSVQALRKIVTQQDHLVQQVNAELRKATQRIQLLKVTMEKDVTQTTAIPGDGADGCDDDAVVPDFDVAASMDVGVGLEDEDITQQEHMIQVREQIQAQTMYIDAHLQQQQEQSALQQQ